MQAERKSPKRIILISVDDLRHDCISCEPNRRYLKRYGVEDRVSTPSIDRFASEGVRFSQAIAPAPYTSLSHASILTGMYPPRHGVRAFFYTKMRPGIVTLAQILRDHGYRTLSSCDFYNLFRTLDLSRGMEVCEDGDNTKILDLAERHRDEKIFLFFHFFDVHDPYGCSTHEIHPGYNDDMKQGFNALKRKYRIDAPSFLETIKKLWRMGHKNEVVAQYVKGVNKFAQGRFAWIIETLTRIGLMEDNLLVLTADHGEVDCGPTFSHGSSLSEEVIRVPLLFHYPDRLSAGRVIDRQCSLVDIMPTILDLAGISPPECDGRSLVPAMDGGVLPDGRVYSERWSHNIAQEEMMRFSKRCEEEQDLVPPEFDVLLMQRSVRTPDYKFVLTGKEHEPVDLGSDDAFLKWAFHSILHKHADEHGFNHWMGRLRGNTLDRTALLETFTRQAGETYSLFDLKTDPFEKVNLLDNRSFLPMSETFLDTIETIESSQDLLREDEAYISFDSQAEAAEIEGQLRSLGYI